MSLQQYKKKRTFDTTPEPKGGTPKGGQLRFVVQKHQASHLHYDFRLEMDGVLKSWAVPKGPSTNPATKRLAMMVEDHPYAYKDFEGVIPEGNYGAGTVIIWDQGIYEPLEEIKTKKAQEKALLKQLEEGSIKFRLKGEKLKGEYALVRTKGMGENSWLLIKHKDEFASKSDISKLDKSVVSGLDLDEMAKNPKKIYGQSRKSKVPNAGNNTEPEAEVEEAMEAKGVESSQKESSEDEIASILKRAKKGPMPKSVQPMLATLVKEPFEDADWEFEIKWDGYRAISYLDGEQVEIKSRNDKPFHEKYYPIHESLKMLGLKAVIDGEIVVVDKKGISNFGKLQNWRSEADGQLLYYVFDILWYQGKNLMDLPLKDRKALLEHLIPKDMLVRTGFSVLGEGLSLFETAEKIGLEGIMAKSSTSKYSPGARSKEWLKIKVENRQEAIILGYTKNEGSPKPFSALLLGVYENDTLKYVGKVGTGFKQKEQKEMLKLFQPLVRKTPPLKEEPNYNLPSRFRPNPPNAKATWLKPELVCEIQYTELTSDGSFRHPSFQGMRMDKSAKEVVLETEAPTSELVQDEEQPKDAAAEIIKPPKKAKRKTLLNPKEESQVKKIDGIELKFTNLSKIYWPGEGITKRDLLNYYYQVAPYIIEYLKDRPQSLNRFPNGIKGKSFYQKNVTGKVPDWAKTFPYESEGEEKNYLLGSNEASLLYMANLGAIEMNPWSSTIHNPDQPDWCILDLDPGSKSSFDDVIETALVIKKILEELGVPGYPKTSGATGMHIYIPLGANYTYDQSQLFARWIAAEAQSRLPDKTSVERLVKNRKGLLYVDFLQNRPTATLASPYSARPKPGATVSTPLHWEEVKKGLKVSDFTLFNVPKRVSQQGDIFKPVLGDGIDLLKVIEDLE